ncbi:hydrophobin [Flammula alnicola]|nr:hydrophobin [Flammula alnicola]
MFTKITTIILAVAFAVQAVATNAPATCNTGSVQCCNQLFKSDSHDASTLLARLGIVIQGLTGLVGQNCSPITGVGVGSGASCVSSPVCCANNNFNGELVSLGCSPVSVNA